MVQQCLLKLVQLDKLIMFNVFKLCSKCTTVNQNISATLKFKSKIKLACSLFNCMYKAFKVFNKENE